MSLHLQIIVIYIKEKLITKLQKLYSPSERAGNKSPALFVKKPRCKGDLLQVCKIFIERPDMLSFANWPNYIQIILTSSFHIFYQQFCFYCYFLHGDSESKPGPKKKEQTYFSLCHWDLNSLVAHKNIVISCI